MDQALQAAAHQRTHGCMEAEEVFHGSKVGGLHIRFENLGLYSSFIGMASPL
jgi:hypothetical protein